MSSQNIDMKNLLSKWKLECILSHLLAEKIDTDILEMMKLSHIRLLLYNFPLGIQIRFEYYLEQWREEIGKPLQLLTNDERLQLSFREQDIKNKITTKAMDNKATQTDLIIYNISSLSNIHRKNLKDVTTSKSSRPDQKKLELPPELLSADVCLASKSLPLSTLQVDLLGILKSATCGNGLITNYGLRQTFSNSERELLIETIITHYIKNNMEINVETSYALERAILKMFPSEKLSFYRTNKHGRLYLRYKSIKTAEQQISEIYEVDNSIDLSEEFEELYQFSGDSATMQTNITAETVINDSTEINGENCEESMDESVESVGSIFNGKNSDNSENNSEYKFNSKKVDIATTHDSEVLIRKMLSKKRKLIEDIDRPFINFNIPWQKLPYNVLCALENGQSLGKSINVVANLIVNELRQISTHVPMRVLRAVSQQAAMRYPHSFLEKDDDGNVKPSKTTPLLSRLRNRNTFLNRQSS